MSAPKLKKCRGLYTASNRYDVPEGALVQANNILILKDGVIQPRWSLRASSTSMATGNVSHWHRASSLGSTLWYAGRDTVAATLRIGYADPSSFAGVTALSQTENFPDTAANFEAATTPWFDVEFLRLGNLLYANTFRGLVRIESTSTQRLAGSYPCAVSCFPRPLAVSLSRSGTTTVTATTTIQHGYVPGIYIALTTAGSADFGTGGATGFAIVTVPSATTFTYVDSTATSTTTLGSQGVSALQIVGSSGFMATDDRTAYRACLTEYDTNGNEYVGEVSGRVVVTNGAPFVGAANAKNVQLAVLYQSAALSANTKVELYRAKGVASAEPGAEYGLVYSKFLTTLDISRGYVWITDINADSETGYGKSLYTNDSQAGDKSNNSRPAGCKTVAVWGKRLVQANTFDRPKVDLFLKSVDSTSGGMVAGDVIAFVGSAATTGYYEAVASTGTIGHAGKFCLYTGGTVSSDVKHTVLSLINSINWAGSAPSSTGATTSIAPLSGLMAVYTSEPTGQQGRFSVIIPTADQYEATSATALSRAVVNNILSNSTRDCFAPKLGEIAVSSAGVVRASGTVTVTTVNNHRLEVGETVQVFTDWANQTAGTIDGAVVSGTILTVPSATTLTFANAGTDGTLGGISYIAPQYQPRFQNNHLKNQLRVSGFASPLHPGHAEGFPAFNTIAVGAPNANILKCVPCKDSLMVFKEDGLFRATASGAYGEALSAELIDPNAILWAKDTAVPINGAIMAWLTKGVAIINESGVAKYVSTNRVEDKLSLSLGTLGQYEPYQLQSYPYTRRAQAFVDEQAGLYELRMCLATSPSAPYASTVNLIYNIFNDTWVEDDLAVVSEVFHEGLRYIQQGTTFYFQENVGVRGGGALTTQIATLSSFNSTAKTVAFTYTGAAPSVGATAVNSDTSELYYVLAASGGSGTLYVPSRTTIPSVPASQAFYNPVVSTIEWAPITFNEENKLKMHREVQALFGVSECMVAETTTYSDLISTTETVVNKLGAVSASSITPISGFKPEAKRFAVPTQHRVGQQLNFKMVIRCAYGAWTILGIGVDGKVLGPKVAR